VVDPGLFDVEQFRALPHRHAVVRQVERPTLVLGSTQSPDVVSRVMTQERGVEVVRRRGGGGAVLLQPNDHVWVNAWIPRGDPLWRSDVGAAAAWVGEWWLHGLGVMGQADWSVHREKAQPGEFGDLVCFAGRGPGEVFWGQRKVVGVSQWRSREGALFLSCAYTQWQPGALVELLHLDAGVRADLARGLVPVVAGLSAIEPPVPNMALVGAALLSSFPAWGSDTPSAS
jgi:lipoate---protein ligase